MAVFDADQFSGTVALPRIAAPQTDFRSFEATFSSTTTPSVLPAAGDVIRLFKIPAGYRIIYLLMDFGDFGGATIDFDVGTYLDTTASPAAGDVDAYLDAIDVGTSATGGEVSYPEGTGAGLGRAAQAVDEYMAITVLIAAITAAATVNVFAIGIKQGA